MAEIYKGLLVFPVTSKDEDIYRAEMQEEFERLLKNIDIRCSRSYVFEQRKVSPRTYIGKGHLGIIAGMLKEEKYDALCFLKELTPTSRYNLEKELGAFVPVITDREEVIIEIFRRNARSAAAALQVELAFLRYELPRLKGAEGFSRPGGSIGTTGPGEQKLEYQRRNVLKRISVIKGKLKKIENNYRQQSKKRRGMFTAAICGYTNSGKSTLLNCLTGSDAATMTRPFSTLDTLVKRGYIEGDTMLFVDTIGFIRDLPSTLLIAFKTTLSTLSDVDLVIKMYDISAKDIGVQMGIVNEYVSEIAKNKKELVVFNKVDTKFGRTRLEAFRKRFPEAVFISAKKGENIDFLKQVLKKYKEKVKYQK